MRAIAVFPNTREIRMIDQPEPLVATPTEVKVRVLEVGICGTDREIATFRYGTPPRDSEYLVLGHESLVEVVEVGSGVSRMRPGDLAVPTVRRPCPHADCTACIHGRQDFCYTGDFTERGIKEEHGFMTDLVVDEERNLVPVSPGLREFAVLTEPLTVAEKALMQVQEVQQRLPWVCAASPGARAEHCHRAVVLGAGPVGLLGAMALLTAGFETTVYSRDSGSPSRARFVESLGARFLDADTHTIQEVAAAVGNIDLVYEATGAAGVSFELLRVLGVNGVFVFTGVPGRRAPLSIDAGLLMRDLVLKNQIVFGTVNAPREAYDGAVRDLAGFAQRWPETLRRMITGRFAMAEYERLLVDPPSGIKNVITLA